MPDSTSLKEFVISVRTRRRYYSQCTPEKTINVAGIFMFNNFYILNVQNISYYNIKLYIYFRTKYR